MVKIKLSYELTVKDKDGKTLSREKRVSRSLVRQWADAIMWLAQASDKTITNTGGSSVTLDRDRNALLNALRQDGEAAIDSVGIGYATSTVAVAIDDYVLTGQIGHGSGSGQLQYQAGSISAVSVAGATASWTNTRVGINGSGATITVSSIGILAKAVDTAGVSQSFLIVRDILASSQAVPDGGSITVVYTWQVTV